MGCSREEADSPIEPVEGMICWVWTTAIRSISCTGAMHFRPSVDLEAEQHVADPAKMSWDIETLPVAVPGYLHTSHLVFDSTELYEQTLAQLEGIIYLGLRSRIHVCLLLKRSSASWGHTSRLSSSTTMPLFLESTSSRTRVPRGRLDLEESSVGQATVTEPDVAPLPHSFNNCGYQHWLERHAHDWTTISCASPSSRESQYPGHSENSKHSSSANDHHRS